jgi:EmrB/QacA subfamily drug resistance transporter
MTEGPAAPLATPADGVTLPATATVVPPAREALIVAGVLLALLMGALDQFVVLTALPNILLEFGQPNSGTFVVSAYIIASTTAVPIFAKLSDLWSRRNVFISGLVIFIAGSILAGLSQNLSELILFRAVQGFGSGDFFPVGIAIVAVTFPPETRARITGLLSGVFGIATVAGPLLGSAIIDHASWRWVFYVNIPVGLLGLGVILATLGPLRPEHRRPFDVPGAVLLFGWVAALMFPLIQVSDAGWSWTDPRVVGLLLGAAVLAVIFVLWELRAKEPLVPLRLLKHRVVAASGGATFLIGMTFFPLATFLSLVVGLVLSGGVNAADTVRDVLYALVLPLVVGAALGGQLLTRVAYRTIIVVGVILSLIGLAVLTGLSVTTPTWKFAYGFLPVGGVILPLIPLGFGIGLTFPVFLLATQNQVAAKDVGEAGGFIQFLQSLGGAIGLSLLSSYQQFRLGVLDPSPDPSCATSTPVFPTCATYLSKFPTSVITSYDNVFTIMLVLLVGGLVFGLFLQGRLPKGQRPGAGPTP